MITAFIFDLDGTLVQTEKLKALSYARAAVELCPKTISEAAVIEAFQVVVGRSRREVATTLVEQFNLVDKSMARAAEFGVTSAWQAFVQVRLGHYEAMLADPQVILDNQWPHNMALLKQARAAHCCVALATMSHCKQASRVLRVLGLAETFDFVATRDDVTHGKPNPEIYELVSAELKTPPAHCLVIEDSPSGIRAAVAAGMHCIAVTTPFTREHVRADGILAEEWIVDDGENLADVINTKLDTLK